MMYGSSYASTAYGGLIGTVSIPRYIGRFALRASRRAFTLLAPVRSVVVSRSRRAFTLRLPEV